MTKIEWTQATLFGGPLPRRCRKCRLVKAASEFKRDISRRDGISYVCRECDYVRLNLCRPGSRERIAKAVDGAAWCSGCAVWLPAASTRNGKCLECRRQYDRRRYATDPDYRSERRQHAHARKRGVQPVPVEGRELLTHAFDGLCAYCDNEAATWDHVVPITRGGQTTPNNILPACSRCNSSKGNRDLLMWLEATGRTMKLQAWERLAHYQVLE